MLMVPLFVAGPSKTVKPPPPIASVALTPTVKESTWTALDNVTV